MNEYLQMKSILDNILVLTSEILFTIYCFIVIKKYGIFYKN